MKLKRLRSYYFVSHEMNLISASKKTENLKIKTNENN